MRARANTLTPILVAIALLAPEHAFAQQPELAGTWQGQLPLDAGTSLTIRFTFSKGSDGRYTAVLNSLDNDAIRNLPAGTISWNAGTLKVDVPELTGSYAGTLEEGRIDGRWTQQGTAIPLALSPIGRPATQADVDLLRGAWHAEVPQLFATFELKFTANAARELAGTASVLESGGAETALSDVTFSQGALSFTVPALKGNFSGTLMNGAIDGVWKQVMPPGPMPVSLRKGPAPGLALDAAAYALLTGLWTGKQGRYNATLQFSKDASGRYLGRYTNVDLGAVVAINEATFKNNRLNAKVRQVNGELTLDLKGDTLTGTWPGRSAPVQDAVTLTRK